MKYLFKKTILSILCTWIFFACTKQDYYKDGGLAMQSKVEKQKTVYEYLRSKPGIFDSLLAVIDAADLKNEVNRDNITFIAATNLSISRFLVNLGRNTGYSPTSKLGGPIKNLNKEFLKRVLRQYIIIDVKLDLETAYKLGKTRFKTIDGNPVDLWAERENLQEVSGVGPLVLHYDHLELPPNYTFHFHTTMQTHNLYTNNAIIHVLDAGTSFLGFVKKNQL